MASSLAKALGKGYNCGDGYVYGRGVSGHGYWDGYGSGKELRLSSPLRKFGIHSFVWRNDTWPTFCEFLDFLRKYAKKKIASLWILNQGINIHHLSLGRAFSARKRSSLYRLFLILDTIYTSLSKCWAVISMLYQNAWFVCEIFPNS